MHYIRWHQPKAARTDAECVRRHVRGARGSKAERSRQHCEPLINWMSVWRDAVPCWKADSESEGARLTRVASEDRSLRAWLQGRGTRLPDNVSGTNDRRRACTSLRKSDPDIDWQPGPPTLEPGDRKSTRPNSSHDQISYAASGLKTK